jgi:uncharacterized protein with HEPN domain
MSIRENPEEILKDILTASLQAQEFVEGMTCVDFKGSLKTQFAVVRALEIIGEATKRLPLDFRQQNKSLPWRDMAGMRDKLIHGYTTVDYDVVWRTIRDDLPDMTVAIRHLLDELEEDNL